MNANADSAKRERFEDLYESYRLPVLAYCARRTEPNSAADACSEVFLVAWRRFEDVPNPPETLPYLYGIAAKVLSNHARSARRQRRLNARLKNLGVPPPSDPSILVLQSDRDNEVVAAVRKLKPKDREIVMLYAWEDLPRAVIAQMLGMTKAAVDQRIHRAYQRLARNLAHHLELKAFNSPPIAERGGS